MLQLQKTILLLILLMTFIACIKQTSDESIHALLISKDNTIIEKTYFNNATSADLSNVQSLTKSIMSILIGQAIDNNFITIENEPIHKFLPKWFENIKDENKQKITIKHLLNQTSGLEWQGYLEHEDWLDSEDPIGFVLNKKMEANPGETYNYNSGATHLLSAIITNASGMTTHEFANKYLFKPLEIDKLKWEKRNKGYYDGSGLGLSMKAEDLISIGQLLLQNGVYNSTQVISQTWVEKLFNEKEKSPTNWGLRKSKHGYCWYQATLNGTMVNYGMGYGGQFLILVPSKQMVIVTTHNHDTPNGLDQQIDFLKNKLPALMDQS